MKSREGFAVIGKALSILTLRLRPFPWWAVRRAGVIVRLGCFRKLLSPARYGHLRLGCLDLDNLRMRFGVARHEQRAAVGSVLGRYVEGSQLLRLRDDLRFVESDERSEHRHIDRRIGSPDVVERLRGNLAKAFPGHECARMLDAREPLRNAEHEPPI